MPFDIYAQADVVSARLTLAPAASAGNIESTLMEAIRAGVNSPHDLADIFGLAPRLVLQVLGDLWRAGRISVDLETDYETLSLTTVATEELDAAGASAVATSSTTMASEKLVIERLLGRALPREASIDRVPYEDRDLVVPASPTDRAVSQVSEAELVAALSTGDLDPESGSGGGQRVISAFLQPEMLQVATKRRYVRMRAAAVVSEANELTVVVVDDRLSASERARATSRLQDVIDQQPKSKFANRLRERAEPTSLRAKGADEIVRDLTHHVATLETCPYNERQHRHDKAAFLCQQVASLAQSRVDREMEVEVVTTLAEHTRVMRQLIDDAKRQVVLAVPWIRVRGLESIRTQLLDAIERGVQVVLVWGINAREDQMGPSEAAWLDSITAHAHRVGAPGRLLYSRSRAARSHAKLVISDDRRMMVTSKNFLSGTSHLELGVLLTSIGEQHCPAIEAGLQYVYDKAPSPEIAYALHRLPGSFGARTSGAELDLRLPRLQEGLLQETAPPAVVRVWAAAWAEAAIRAEALLSRPRPVVSPVTDLQHRGVLREAAAAANTRLLVASDQLTETALTRDIAALLLDRASEGVTIALRYGRVVDGGVPGLDDLRSGDGAAIDIVHASGRHAKVVMRDDKFLVGSFNPLSVDADLRRRRSTGEFGVFVESPSVADNVWTLVTETPPPTREVPAALAPAAGSADLAQSLLEAAADPKPEALETLVAEHGFDLVLRVARQFCAEVVDEVRVAGAGLSVALDDGGDLEAPAGVAITGLMRTGNWGVASLLRPLVPDPDFRPRASFTTALAEGGGSGQSLLTAMTTGPVPDQAEADALLVADCVHLLLGDEGAAGDSEMLFTAASPSALTQGFFDSAAAYLRRYGALPVAPPVVGIPPSELNDLWEKVADEHGDFSRYDPKAPTGKQLLHALVAQGGELGLLQELLTSRDPDAMLRWQADHLQTTDDGKWLDRTTRALGLPRITDSRRRSFIDHRRRVRVAVDKLCSALAARAAIQQSAWDPDQFDALTRILEQVRLILPLGDHTPEAAAMTAELSRILRWAAADAKPTPCRDWRGWPFVTTHVQADPATADADDVPLDAVARDLAANWSVRDAVNELTRAGEYQRATWVIASAVAQKDPERDELEALINARAAADQDLLTEQLHTLGLRYERAGLQPPTQEPGLAVLPRRADAERALGERLTQCTAAIHDRRLVLAGQLAAKTAMAPGWRSYVESLLEDGELLVAERAMTHHDGHQELPRPRAFARWPWRDRSVEHIAGWLNDPETAPDGVRTRFSPGAGDRSGQAVLDALQSVAAGRPEAPEQWLRAVQQLLAPEDDDYRPRLVVDGESCTATFRMPYDQRLPLLSWTHKDGTTVSVGERPSAEVLLRFSLEMSSTTGSTTVVDVADVLSLLARADSDTVPTSTERALQFLAVVCSRLDLASIIEPRDMPAGSTEASRHKLAWLLSILGVTADGRDVDRLSVWSGGHPGVLWSLVQKARGELAAPVNTVLEHPDLDHVLLRGVELDLDHDEDLLVLGLGLAGGLLTEGCSEAELAELLHDEWRDGGRPPEHNVRIAEVVRRLEQHGYIRRDGGRLLSCGCLTARAIERRATSEWLADRMDLIDLERLMHQAAYEIILELVRHQEQAEAARMTPEELDQRAQERLTGRLEDDSAFDLTDLCSTAQREYYRGETDVISEFPTEPLWAREAGPSIWIECLVYELLNNALAATTDLPAGAGTIWIDLQRDPDSNHHALLSVRNNGRRVPEAVREAFEAGRRIHDPARPHNGTGLYRLKRLGAPRGVEITLSETDLQQTVVQCRIPLSSTD